MRGSTAFVGVMIALVLAASGGMVRAEDACRANCDEWLASCRRACVDTASNVDDCKNGCRIADQACLADCND